MSDTSSAHACLVKFITDYFACHDAWLYKVWGGPFARRGVPDVLACLPPSGRLVAVEAKTGMAQLDKYQRAERVKLERAGALYILCRAPEQLEVDLLAAGLVDAPSLLFPAVS